MTIVNLKDNRGDIKRLKIGFSWTTFFFGVWVPMFRGQWVEVLKWFFLNPLTFFTWGIFQWFNANRKTIIFNLERGYRPLRKEDHTLLVEHNIVERFS
ncbi:hypothetical protein [Priestia aryabhattai]|uniref:hypothetical protein n=1 Tax=Priestia aryabhattai TaxID=412384 RepID=UPI001C8DB812|nr:hypothetical protein [Priestia aryabhattai]MBX9988120.1 hypothetical protein [Priestia aryabhattai]MBY0001513.1 hypothetical protein [Priestia aryabhattai]